MLFENFIEIGILHFLKLRYLQIWNSDIECYKFLTT